MRSISVNVYKFSELSDKAKERAKTDYARDEGYAWSDYAFASLEALAAHFGGRLSNWSIDYFKCGPSSAEFSMPEELEPSEIEGRLNELGEYNPKTLMGLGDCKLTGVCFDEDAIDGFRIAWHAGERDLHKLMQAAFKKWLSTCQADCEDQYSDERFSEHCDANNYEFYENGKFKV